MKQMKDALLRVTGRLEQVLAPDVPGRERAWTEEVDRTLAEVEQVLQRDTTESGSPDGQFGEVDFTRPTLARRVSALRRELTEFLGEAQSLRAAMQSAAQAFTRRSGAATQSDAVPEPARPGGVPDFGNLRERLQQFAAALRQYKGDEAGVVLESVTTDIGAGD